ncbi:MAG: hypothetical protein P8080_02945 [Gammaproteobacteria bacterium]
MDCLIANKRDDAIIGAHVIGPMAGELISELVVAMIFTMPTACSMALARPLGANGKVPTL